MNTVCTLYRTYVGYGNSSSRRVEMVVNRLATVAQTVVHTERTVQYKKSTWYYQHRQLQKWQQQHIRIHQEYTLFSLARSLTVTPKERDIECERAALKRNERA